MDKRKKIVFITGKLVKGGSERVISILANHFAQTCDVRIFTLLSEEIEYDIDDSVEIVKLVQGNKYGLLKVFFWLRYLINEFRKLRKEDSYIISFIAKVNLLVLVANLFAGIPIIVSERNDPKKDGRGFIVKALVSLLYPTAGFVVFQSAYAKSLFSEKVQKIGRVIPNPIIKREVQSPGKVKKAFINVGRLSEQKNQALLIDAFSIVVNKHPEYSLLIYGEGPLEQTLRRKIVSLGLLNHIKLMGVTDNLIERLVECKCFILSSDYEGLSNALLEAMALGMPCITTDLPGHRGLVHEKNALLVEVGSVVQLSKAMLDIIENEELGPALGSRAKEEISKLSNERIILEWEGLMDYLHEK